MAGDPIRPVKLSSNHSVTGICTVDLPRRGKRSAATTALPKRFGQGKRARRLKERVEKAVGARVEWRMKREARGCRSHRGLEIEGRNRAATQKKARPLKRARRHRACAPPPPCPRPWNATLPMEPQPAFQRVVRRNGVLDLEFPAQLRRRQAAGPGASTSAAAGGAQAEVPPTQPRRPLRLLRPRLRRLLPPQPPLLPRASLPPLPPRDRTRADSPPSLPFSAGVYQSGACSDEATTTTAPSTTTTSDEPSSTTTEGPASTTTTTTEAPSTSTRSRTSSSSSVPAGPSAVLCPGRISSALTARTIHRHDRDERHHADDGCVPPFIHSAAGWPGPATSQRGRCADRAVPRP